MYEIMDTAQSLLPPKMPRWRRSIAEISDILAGEHSSQSKTHHYGGGEIINSNWTTAAEPTRGSSSVEIHSMLNQYHLIL